MKKNDNERPKVTKVVVTVTRPIINENRYSTRILMEVDSLPNSSNFDFYPRLEFPVGDAYQTRGIREYENDAVVYTETGLAFDYPLTPLVNVRFIRNGTGETVTLEYEIRKS